jgi:hypothetical protein
MGPEVYPYGMRPHSQFARNGVHHWTAFVVVLVMASFGFLQAVHAHDSPANDARPNAPATHCASCVAAHSVAVKAEASFAPALSQQPGTTFTAEPQLKAQLVLFTSFIRPPPAS